MGHPAEETYSTMNYPSCSIRRSGAAKGMAPECEGKGRATRLPNIEYKQLGFGARDCAARLRVNSPWGPHNEGRCGRHMNES
jgi:hypothetical protein